MPTQIFSHLILTRFNVKLLDAAPPDVAWLERRFELFDKFCYPSVRRQSNQNFKWLVFFDADTPQAFKDKIKTYAQWNNFSPVYTNCETFFGFHFPEALKSIIRRNVDQGSDFLITSRLDNDDAIHRDFVQTVQEAFSQQQLEAINFTWGLQLYKGKLILCKHFSSPFISLIENYDEDSFKTVFIRGHNRLSEVCSIRNIVHGDEPMWMQVIHDDNTINRRRWGRRIRTSELVNGFEIDLLPDSSSLKYRLSMLLENALCRSFESRLLNWSKNREARMWQEKFRRFTKEFYENTDDAEALRQLVHKFKSETNSRL